MIAQDRLRGSQPPRDGAYVLYWIRRSFRVDDNPSLLHASRLARDLKLPLVAFATLTPAAGASNPRIVDAHEAAVTELAHALSLLRIPVVLTKGNPVGPFRRLAADASMMVLDRTYLREERVLTKQVLDCAPWRVVEGDVVVPCDAASSKEEYAARTLRPKIHRILYAHLEPAQRPEPQKLPVDWILPSLGPEQSPLPNPAAVSKYGETAARSTLEDFLSGPLTGYAQNRNVPGFRGQSGLAPFLRIGAISPRRIAREVLQNEDASSEDKDAFLEELIVRRELSFNFVLHNPLYDSFDGLPDWARTTLRRHAGDPREKVYSRDALETADTDDPYWNAAQRQLVRHGGIHGYMRMYWGKRLLTWTRDPREAFDIALKMNNDYALDGFDPNSFAGVAWCFGKHDRPWPERAIFGTVRTMTASGLTRKFNMRPYLERFGNQEDL